MRHLGFLGTLTMMGLVLSASLAHPQPRTKAPAGRAAPSGSHGYALPNVAAQKWTGDLDGMVKRRQVRIVTVYSKTFYFVDRGVQRGLTYDIGQILEAALNKKGTGPQSRVYVVYVPVARDQIIPALLEGRGDIAIANLTITPERLKHVDFAPTMRNVAEIVVTGPGAALIRTVQDLAGKEVYIQKSSSFHESIAQLNAELAKAGKAPTPRNRWIG